MASPPKIFVSYSHEDRKWLDRLQVHFKALERDGTIDVWDDTDITMGSDWDEEIETALKEARAAILLVSADFLASDYIANEELNVLLEAEERGLLILMVILRPCILGTLSRFQSVNDPSRPLEGMTVVEQEEVFVRLVEGVKQALLVEAEAQPAAASTAAPLPKTEFPHLRLQVHQEQDPAQPPEVYVFQQERIIIGRDPATDLTLLNPKKRVISKQHAEIIWDGDTAYLTDLDSMNFTYLNEQQLQSHQRYALAHGDTIEVGSFKINVEILETAPTADADAAVDDDLTAFRRDYVNPYEADVQQLAAVVQRIGEQYAGQASRRERVALHKALRDTFMGTARNEAYFVIARWLLRDVDSTTPRS